MQQVLAKLKNFAKVRYLYNSHLFKRRKKNREQREETTFGLSSE